MSLNASRLAHRATIIKRSLGAGVAAGFLRNRGVSLEEALLILVGKKVAA